MIVLRLAAQSLANRRLTATLTVLAIALSVAMALAVERIRTGARTSFADTISGTDLIVGARTGQVQLLLYAIFRIGNATNNITWQSYTDIARLPDVAWTVPLSLGDSHRGFRVLGTTPDYFEHYRFRQGQRLAFAGGKPIADLFDTVIGADVATALGYKVGDRIVVAHGLGNVSFSDHEDKPFRVAGILAKTGTPVDRTVHVSLAAIEAIHVDWQSGAPIPGQSISADEVRRMTLEPKAITAIMIGLKSRLAVLKVQRAINTYREEPLSAVLPGVALQELWQLVGTAETALSAVSLLVVATALLGMVTNILTTLNERRREMAILRSLGARPATVLGLLTAEAALLTTLGVAAGLALLYIGMWIAQPWLDAAYGLYLPIEPLDASQWRVVIGVLATGILGGLLPAIRAYRMSVADGMTIRI